MRLPRLLHAWGLTPRQAIGVQRKLAARVHREGGLGGIRFVAGLDAAFTGDGQYCLAAVVLWDLQTQTVVEERTGRHRLRFPYIPGLLSFREVPALLAALRRLERTPEVLLCDGQGYAHPRRFGLACHLGVLCDLPAVGCAKSRLIGTHAEPALARGGRAPLLDHEEIIGTVLRTRFGTRPVYVSVGHKLGLAAAEELVLRCAVGYRLPEPTRLADIAVAAHKRATAP